MPGIHATNHDQGTDRLVQEHPAPEPIGDKPVLPVVDKRARWETILAPVGLTILGLVMISAGLVVNPQTSEASAPVFSTVEVDAHFHIFSVSYDVSPWSSTVDEIKVYVDLPTNVKHPPSHKPAAQLTVSLPSGISYWH